MPVKLYYFNTRGICEPIRLILTYGGIEFEDIRAPLDSMPPKLPQNIKEKARWGTTPLVEFEGKSLNQSIAIARYFAKKAKLVPEDPFQAALADEYVDAIRDCMLSFFMEVVLVKDPVEKEIKLKEVRKKNGEKFLDVFESIIKANGGKYFIGDGPTWADIYLTHLLNNFELVLGVDLANGYPNMSNLKVTILNIPKIREWVEKRPKTHF